jgi:hypothetical protein
MIKKVFSFLIIFFVFLLGPFFYGMSVYGQDDEGGVTIGTGEGFVRDVFGNAGLVLNIFRPFNLGGHVTIYSLAALILEYAFPLLFLAFIVVVGIGGIKWISSQGNDTKVQNASKWLKNGVIGFLSTVFVFVGVNLITWFVGIGSVYHLAENLVVCEDNTGKLETMFDHKRNEGLGAEYSCTCVEEGVGYHWECTIEVSGE